MSNSYFQFKEFTVHQQKAAMKVCTDACLFGAWVAEQMNITGCKIEKILDIGTGTGLLALMLAQKTPAAIHAVEINESTAAQAKENFEQSKFSDRVELLIGDIRTLAPNTTYDLIICNPPFYEKDLKSSDKGRNDALHSAALNFHELIPAAAKALEKQGIFAVLLPFFRAEDFILLAEKHDLFVRRVMHVSQTENHSFFRSMLIFSAENIPVVKSTMTIKDNGVYSDQFVRLLRDYYLYL